MPSLLSCPHPYLAMLYLGEYYEAAAKEIKDYLNDAGIKVEARPCLSFQEEITFSVKDRFSVLSGYLEESDREEYRKGIETMKKVFAQAATEEDLFDRFLKELHPSIMEKRDRILALSKDGESLTDEEKAALNFSEEEWAECAESISQATTLAIMIVNVNSIKIGEPLDDRLDDPIMHLVVDPDDYDEPPKNMRRRADYSLEKSVTLYVDEYSTVNYDRMTDEFWQEWGQEAECIEALGLLMSRITQPPEGRKMDFSDFQGKCSYYFNDDTDTLRVSAEEVAEDLARVLEKYDILKRKGDRVKWKGRD